MRDTSRDAVPDGSDEPIVQGEAIVAVLVRADRFLVHRRAEGVPMAGYWAPLSGKVEPGEDQPAAVVREVAEEIGLRVYTRHKVWECDTHDGAYRLHWWLVDEADAVDEVDAAAKPTLDPTEVAEIRWVTVEEFTRLSPTFDSDRRFFRDILPEVG